MSKHTIVIEELKTTRRLVHIETDDKHPTLDSLRELVAMGINNLGFDEIGELMDSYSDISIDDSHIDNFEV